MDEEIKKEIANYFLLDSREYLKRYELLQSTQTEISNRSKLLIDIIFSFECSLKALIFLESTTDEKSTYKIIKDCSHKLIKLIHNVNKEPINEIVLLIGQNIDHLSINSRYTLEANIYFRNQNGALDQLYYDTIANHNWLNKLFDNAKKLNKYVESLMDNSLKSTNYHQIDLELKLKNVNRIKNIARK